MTQSAFAFRCARVVLTAGTFLDGRIHVGLQNYAGGRAGDPPAATLSARLKELKLPQGRLKTGTPPRIDGRSIDFGVLEAQPGDGMPGADGSPPTGPVPVFSFLGDAGQHPRQVPCWITHTNERTHDIIRVGLRPQPDVHRRDRRRRPALLPEHRGQGQSLCRQGRRTRSSWSPKG